MEQRRGDGAGKELGAHIWSVTMLVAPDTGAGWDGGVRMLWDAAAEGRLG